MKVFTRWGCALACAAVFAGVLPASPASATQDAVRQDTAQSMPGEVVVLALASPAQLDRVGVQRSLYRGRFFKPRQEPLRTCIVRRESNGRYNAVNPRRSYFGAYQMSRELAVGVTWMMVDEHAQLLGARAAKRILRELRTTPPHRWNRYWQDAAFYTIANWKHTGSGLRHWAGGRWRC